MQFFLSSMGQYIVTPKVFGYVQYDWFGMIAIAFDGKNIKPSGM